MENPVGDDDTDIDMMQQMHELEAVSPSLGSTAVWNCLLYMPHCSAEATSHCQ